MADVGERHGRTREGDGDARPDVDSGCRLRGCRKGQERIVSGLRREYAAVTPFFQFPRFGAGPVQLPPDAAVNLHAASLSSLSVPIGSSIRSISREHAFMEVRIRRRQGLARAAPRQTDSLFVLEPDTSISGNTGVPDGLPMARQQFPLPGPLQPWPR